MVQLIPSLKPVFVLLSIFFQVTSERSVKKFPLLMSAGKISKKKLKKKRFFATPLQLMTRQVFINHDCAIFSNSSDPREAA